MQFTNSNQIKINIDFTSYEFMAVGKQSTQELYPRVAKLEFYPNFLYIKLLQLAVQEKIWLYRELLLQKEAQNLTHIFYDKVTQLLGINFKIQFHLNQQAQVIFSRFTFYVNAMKSNSVPLLETKNPPVASYKTIVITMGLRIFHPRCIIQNDR